MKLIDLFKNISVEIKGNENIEINNITIDSRQAKKGSLFVCIKGLNVDGHNYIEKAIENGCEAVVTEKDVNVNCTVCTVKSTRETLSFIASNLYNNPAKNLKLIGVTGTNGKTSSTYFISKILENAGKKVGVIGTTGVLINSKELDLKFLTSTTPEAHELQEILKVMENEKVEYVVMEVTSQGLHQDRTKSLTFDVSIFTNLKQDHLDYHNTMEEYGTQKGKLFELSKKAIINSDDKYGNIMTKFCKGLVKTYSIEKESNYKAQNIVYTAKNINFDLEINNKLENIEVNIPGRFTIYNVLGVISALIEIGINIDTIKEGLKQIQGVRGRIESVPNNKNLNVFIDYAHSPDALENVISAVKEFTSGKVITVFGCGGDRDRTKRPIMAEVASRLSDFCIVTSDNPRSEDPTKIVEEVATGIVDNQFEMVVDRKEAIYRSIEMAKENDSVIIAGKGHETYQIFKDGTIDFDDREVAKEALEEK